jgi:acetyl esterase/lipase
MRSYAHFFWSVASSPRLALLFIPKMLVFGALQIPLAPFYAWHFFLRAPRTVLRYGPLPRQHVVIYSPPPTPRDGPVLTTMVVSGGAWMLSSTAWGWPMLRALAPAGHCVVLLGHRQFPAASAAEQAADILAAVKAVAAVAPSWGGSASDLQLVGQSAGAHLAACAALGLAQEGLATDAAAAAAAAAARPPPPPLRLRTLVLASGIYDVGAFLPLLRGKGLPAGMLRGLFGDGAAAHRALSPRFAVEEPGLAAWWPPTALLHGALDTAVPAAQSVEFHAALLRAGAAATLEVFPDVGHTHFVIEGPAAGRDEIARSLARDPHEAPLFPFAAAYMRAVTAASPFS